jgi:DNA polymerase-3 subunit delta
MTRWIAAAARQRSCRIDADAVEMLAEWIGADLAALDSEIEKLSLYTLREKRITVEDIAAIVTSSAGPAAFGLTNAIAAGATAEALHELGKLLSRRGDEFMVLGQIGWHLRRALAAKGQLETGAAPKLAMPPSARNAFLSYLHRRPLERFRDDFRGLMRADLAAKSGTDPGVALQLLVVNLCR